jgi:hypothetical protein
VGVKALHARIFSQLVEAQVIPHCLSKREKAKRILESATRMTMGARKAHRSTKMEHLKFSFGPTHNQLPVSHL